VGSQRVTAWAMARPYPVTISPDQKHETWKMLFTVEYIRGGGGADKSLASYRKQQATGLNKYIYSTYSPLSSTHLWLVVLTSLTHPRKIILVVLEIGKAENLSAPLRTLKRHMAFRKADEPLVCSDKTWGSFLRAALLRSKTSTNSESSIDE
jgi:hypothetical protein